jgi:broad specificity phosphatase PhoE
VAAAEARSSPPLITLIRHGQAGSRLAYDELSEIGQEQARALGQWFAVHGVRFDAIVTGGLNRQRMTARGITAAMGASLDVTVDERWSEFDLDQVYAGIGPLLAHEDERFRLDYAQLQREVIDPESSAHRNWRHCDVMVVRAWIDGRFQFAGESFADFGARVREALLELPPEGHVAVITSATPIAVSAGVALDLAPRRVMQLAGAQRNTAFSEMDLRPGDPLLVSFNNVPHLQDGRLRTLR